MTGPVVGVLFASVAALANVAGGGLVLLRRNWSQRGLKASLAFGGGFMLGAAVLGMAPHSLEIMPRWGAELILVGYLVVHFFEHVVGGHYHFAGDKHGPDHLVSSTVTGATIFAMMVHTFFDGVAIGSAFLVSRSLGLVVLAAVVVHKVPAGFAVSAVALAGGATRGRAFGAAALLGLGTIIGSIALSAAGPLAPYAVPISAGTLIHVAASDLIPEVNEGERWPITVIVIAGGLLFLVVNVLMGGKLH
jgi:zinc transporter ZupT